VEAVAHPDGTSEDVTGVQVINTRTKLKAQILAPNKKHFTQAEGTPFTVNPLQALTTDNATNLLIDDGTPRQLPPGTFTEMATVVETLHVALQSPIPGIPDVVSFDNFISRFLHWNEALSTRSPSGRHLGLYKTLVTAHCNSGSEFQDDATKDDISTLTAATAILTAIHALHTTMIARGLYLHRWIQVINIMIYNKAGVF
jgi:hypothetical protein